MKIGRLKKDFRWNFGISYDDSPIRYDETVLKIWFFKLNELPNEGALPMNYRGFIFEKYFNK